MVFLFCCSMRFIEGRVMCVFDECFGMVDGE